MVNNWLNISRSWLFPVDCLYCGNTLDTPRALCDLCQQSLPINQSCCKHCAEPLANDHFHLLCDKCLKKPPAYDRVYSPYLYQPPISSLISRFKYHADLAAGQTLGQLLADYLQQQLSQPPQCIVPVPLHSTRLRQRGFNQSLQLARVLAKQLAIPVLPDICQR